MSKRKKAEFDEAELDLVRRIARAQARANGHSHPDDHADHVVAAYKGELEPADESEGESAGEADTAQSGGEG